MNGGALVQRSASCDKRSFQSRQCRSSPVSCRPVTCRVYVRGGPVTEQPDYAPIDGQPLNAAIMGLFRRKMVAAIGEDVKSTGYQAIIDLTRLLNTKFQSARETQVRTVAILASLMPSWLPGLFKVMFSKPFPQFACMLNAWATAFTCQWLMGKSVVNDIEIDGGKVAAGHGVKVERCRYLEQSGCVSICVNSCKVPTQEFFAVNMGLPLTMTPNYEDFSCQFAFGKTPEPQTSDPAFASPCFLQCPTKRAASVSSSSSFSAVNRSSSGSMPESREQQGSGNIKSSSSSSSSSSSMAQGRSGMAESSSRSSEVEDMQVTNTAIPLARQSSPPVAVVEKNVGKDNSRPAWAGENSPSPAPSKPFSADLPLCHKVLPDGLA